MTEGGGQRCVLVTKGGGQRCALVTEGGGQRCGLVTVGLFLEMCMLAIDGQEELRPGDSGSPI